MNTSIERGNQAQNGDVLIQNGQANEYLRVGNFSHGHVNDGNFEPLLHRSTNKCNETCFICFFDAQTTSHDLGLKLQL